METDKIFIAAATCNRKKVARISLLKLLEYKKDHFLHITDDCSDQFDAREMFSYADEVVVNKKRMGIHKLRCQQFRHFLYNRNEEFIYFTDCDTIHDPEFTTKLIELYRKYQLPVSIYNTPHHFNGTINNYNDEVLRISMPGVSQMYDRNHVKTIVDYLDKSGDPVYAWDYRVVECLKKPVVTSKLSYVDHFGGEGSIHNKTFSQDKAYNPTAFLSRNRKFVEEYLTDNRDFYELRIE